MIEISNTFILVWLVVLAIICIYLLYMSMTRNNESDNLKSSIANLVRQNKKRDELINFLMERVETLTGAVNNLALPPALMQVSNSNTVNNPAPSTTGMQTEFNGDIHGPANMNIEQQNQSNELSLDDVLNSIHTKQAEYSMQTMQSNTDVTYTDSCNHLHQEVLHVSEFDSHVANNLQSVHESNILSHAEQNTASLNLDDVLSSMPTTIREDDLISTILGADDSASNHMDGNGYNHHNNSDLSHEKLKLLGMNVKQLKQIAKDMNIKSRGNKTELVDTILEKLGILSTGGSTEQPVTLGNLVSSDADMDALLNETTTNNTKIHNTENNNIATSAQLLVEDLPDDI